MPENRIRLRHSRFLYGILFLQMKERQVRFPESIRRNLVAAG